MADQTTTTQDANNVDELTREDLMKLLAEELGIPFIPAEHKHKKKAKDEDENEDNTTTASGNASSNQTQGQHQFTQTNSFQQLFQRMEQARQYIRQRARQKAMQRKQFFLSLIRGPENGQSRESSLNNAGNQELEKILDNMSRKPWMLHFFMIQQGQASNNQQESNTNQGGQMGGMGHRMSGMGGASSMSFGRGMPMHHIMHALRRMAMEEILKKELPNLMQKIAVQLENHGLGANQSSNMPRQMFRPIANSFSIRAQQGTVVREEGEVSRQPNKITMRQRIAASLTAPSVAPQQTPQHQSTINVRERSNVRVGSLSAPMLRPAMPEVFKMMGPHLRVVRKR